MRGIAARYRPRQSPVAPLALLLALTLPACESSIDDTTAAPRDDSGVAASGEALAEAAQVASAGNVADADAGRVLFASKCAACHGSHGHGDGEAAYLLYPKPRDFRTGVFRYTSTWDGTPTDDDLYHAISRGMPGSAMPSWPALSVDERRALVAFVKSLSEHPLIIPAAKPPDPEFGEDGEGIIEVPSEPADDAGSRSRGAEVDRNFEAAF